MAGVHLELPDDLVATLDATAVAAMREAAVIKLYDLGRLSSGKAARIFGISRRAFLELLGRYGVSEFDDTMDVAAEARIGLANARCGHESAIKLVGVDLLDLLPRLYGQVLVPEQVRAEYQTGAQPTDCF